MHYSTRVVAISPTVRYGAIYPERSRHSCMTPVICATMGRLPTIENKTGAGILKDQRPTMGAAPHDSTATDKRVLDAFHQSQASKSKG